jgi:hypothetical protein
MKTLAIIIPAYKGEFFEKTLESFSCQTSMDFTLYIGIDNSPFDFESIIERYKGKIDITYKRFSDNLGGKDLVAQWERCMSLRKEEPWLWMFSDDDFVSPDCVESIIESVKSGSGNTVYHFNVQVVDENNDELNTRKFKKEAFPAFISPVEYIKKRLTFKLNSFVVEYVFSNVLYERCGGFTNIDLAWGSDDATWAKFGKEDGIRTLDKGCVYWRCSSTNISPRMNPEIAHRKLNASLHYLDILHSQFGKEISKEATYFLFRRMANYSAYLTYEDIKTAVEFLKSTYDIKLPTQCILLLYKAIKTCKNIYKQKKIQVAFFRVVRKVLTPNIFKQYTKYRDCEGQQANDMVYDILASGKPCMIAKFGTVELDMMLSLHNEKYGITAPIYWESIRRRNCIYPSSQMYTFCNNAGFFPNSISLATRYYERMMDDIKEVDILGSYIESEKYFNSYMHCKRIDIDGYCAPFKWNKPWTSILRGKKVLVVHPFADSIKKQYVENRENLFSNKNVLPEFKSLQCIKAVQSIAGQETPFKDWFEALKYMEEQITNADFDIAIIGCGAYGFCLSAFVKRLGKQAIHMAGWTQMLFGVYGKRWIEDQPEFASLINEYWTRPSAADKPKNASKVEGACYW